MWPYGSAMSEPPATAASASPVVLFTRSVPGVPEVPAAELRTAGDGPLARSELLDLAARADVLVTMFSDRIDEELLDKAGSRLKGVCNFAVGTDNIDLDACKARGVLVSNTPHAVTEGTADMAWALLLAVARKVVQADRYARSGDWAANGPLSMRDFLGTDLTGKTLHIVGAGRIGYATALRSLGWGMRVLYTARSRHWSFELAPLAAERVGLEEGLARADVVSIHVPLTPETKHLINADRLKRMKSSALLINTARGPIVDEAALAAALKSGEIAGAGLDVFEREPEILPALRELDNAVLTPHIGSAERRYREEMTKMVCANAAAMLAGQAPPNRVV